MKRVLLLGIVLAICILAMPQGVLAATDTATVTANITPISIITAKLTPPTDWTLTRLSANSNEKGDAINVTVDCNQDWNVFPTDAKTTDKGYMTRGDGKKLTDAFLLQTTNSGTSFANLTAAWGTAIQASGPQAATSYYYDIRQQIEPADDAADTYSITITYTLTAI